MDKFIIKYKSRIDGEWGVTFHEKISLTDSSRLDLINVYREHISFDRSNAMVFYDREEAEKICSLFSNTVHQGKVIKK